jgi:hypothetical protein
MGLLLCGKCKLLASRVRVTSTAELIPHHYPHYNPQTANSARIMKVGRHLGPKIDLKEGQPESYNKCQRPQSLRDYHSTRGTDGTETTEQSAVSALLRGVILDIGQY